VHILFCNFEYPPLGGGGGVVNALLAEELAKRHEVTVLTSRGMGRPPESVEGGVRVVRVPVFFRGQQSTASMASMLAYLPMGRQRGRRMMRERSFDVINTHFALPSGPVGQSLSRSSGVPNVLSVHGGDLYDPSKWTSPHRHPVLRAWVRRLLRRADAVVGQSRNTLENVNRYYAPELEPERIPLGIMRPPAGEPASRAELGIDPDEVVLITVGRLVARKGLPQLARMMAGLGEARARLLVVGSGPEGPVLREEADRLGLADRVILAGRVEEPRKFALLRLADAFVSTSQHEGFGLVFLEAMATGLPVLCYDFGGQTDFLEEGVTGHLVPLNDEELFRDRALSLIQEEQRRREMGAENLSRVEEYFIDHCAARYESLFERLVRDRSDREGARA
jgi:glycosyltransferase involved in cell wall biosynthesis